MINITGDAKKSNSLLSQARIGSYFFDYDIVFSSFGYVLTVFALSFCLYLFGTIGFLTGIGFSSFYSIIILYSTAGSLSYALNFKFFNRKNFNHVTNKKITIICILTAIVTSAILIYNLMSFLRVLELVSSMSTIYLPIIVIAVNLFMCRVGDNLYHHESNNIPILLSILFPVIGIMPGFFNYNVIMFVSFLIAFGITKLVRQPFLMLFDSDLHAMHKGYKKYEKDIKSRINNNQDRNQIIDIIKGDKIDDFVANRILDKVVMKLIAENFDEHQIKEYILQNSSNTDITRYFNILSPNLIKWIASRKIHNKIKWSHANKFLKLIINYDFATTRGYYLKPNSSQSSLELSSTIFILLVLSPLSVLLPNLFVTFSFFVTISSLTLGILAFNLGVLYYSEVNLGYKTQKYNIAKNENKILFGIRYSHKPDKDQALSGSANFNTYFLIIISLFLLYIFQNVFFDMYVQRQASFIPWVSFWPQVMVFGTTILFTLSVFLKSYDFSLENRIVYLVLILYSGIIINIFCPQLLLLFSATPTLTNYMVIIGLTALGTHLFAIIGHDEPMPRSAYDRSPASPYRHGESYHSLTNMSSYYNENECDDDTLSKVKQTY